MGIRAWLRRLIGGEKQASDDDRAEAAAWLEACDAGLFSPPTDMRDAEAWDRYWRNQLRFARQALQETALSDMMASDEALPPLLVRRGARTVLCVGNGLSQEALSMAVMGFAVTALDISAIPARLFQHWAQAAENPLRRSSAFAVQDGSVVFSGTVEPALRLAIHRGPDCPDRAGGSLSLVSGDLMDPTRCPGPFDVVIERRTLQLFGREEQEAALDRVVARLGTPGLLVSHEHHGHRRPGDGEELRHHAERWLRGRGFVVDGGGEPGEREGAARLALLRLSAG